MPQLLLSKKLKKLWFNYSFTQKKSLAIPSAKNLASLVSVYPCYVGSSCPNAIYLGVVDII